MDKTDIANKEPKKEKKGLSFKEIVGYVIENFSKNRLMHFFIVVIFSFSILVFTLMATIILYTNTRNLTRYYNAFEPNYMVFSQEVEYIDELGNNYQKSLVKGQILQKNIKKAFGYTYGVLKGQEVCDIEGDFLGKINLGMSHSTAWDFRLEGNYPLGETDVALPDHFMERAALNIGDEIKINDIQLTITGKILTTYKDVDFSNRYLDQNPNFIYKYNFEYNLGIVNEKYVDLLADNTYSIELNGDITKHDYFGSYNYYTLEYGTINKFEEDVSLKLGSMPVLDNEVMVSETVYSKINKPLYYGISFTLPNLEEEKYHNAHSDVLNLYNFYESGMTIVGVYEDSEHLPDVLITNANFQKIKEEYFKYYAYDNYLNYLNEGYGDIISKLNENSLIWEDPGAKAVLVFSNLKYKLHFGFYLALFLLAVVTTALLVVVFRQNFIDNKDMVKTLIKEGASKKDIYWIFLFKAMAIGSIAMILSMLTLIITLIQINQNMQVNFDIEFNIIQFRYPLYFTNLLNTMLLLIGSAHLLAKKLIKSLDNDK